MKPSATPVECRCIVDPSWASKWIQLLLIWYAGLEKSNVSPWSLASKEEWTCSSPSTPDPGGAPGADSDSCVKL